MALRGLVYHIKQWPCRLVRGPWPCPYSSIYYTGGLLAYLWELGWGSNARVFLMSWVSCDVLPGLALLRYRLTIIKPYGSMIVLDGLALFWERTRALETAGGSDSASDSGSWSCISTSMVSGEGSLGGPLIGLASFYYIITFELINWASNTIL